MHGRELNKGFCLALVKVTYPVNGSKGLGKIATQLLINSGTDTWRIRVDIDTSGVFIASTNHLPMFLDCSCKCNNDCCNQSHPLPTLTLNPSTNFTFATQMF